jgi:hypothetical protein
MDREAWKRTVEQARLTKLQREEKKSGSHHSTVEKEWQSHR